MSAAARRCAAIIPASAAPPILRGGPIAEPLSPPLPPDELEQRLRPDYPHVVFSRLLCEAEPVPDPDPSLLRQFGRELPEAGLEGGAVFYVGGEGLPLTNLMLSWNRCAFSSFDPATGRARRESLDVNRALRRRLYLVERARDARAVGILVGTLGVAGYREALRHLRDTLRRAGKRSYTLAVGKPSPTKLANFPELDVFVLVACAQNSLLDSHGFYRPVVTPFELELACNPARTWTGSYLTDFRDLLPGSAWPGGSSWGSGGLSTLLPHRPGAGTPPRGPAAPACGERPELEQPELLCHIRRWGRRVSTSWTGAGAVSLTAGSGRWQRAPGVPGGAGGRGRGR